MLEADGHDGWAPQDASEELRRDREVVIEAVSQEGDAVRSASEELRRRWG